jgi:hypothetical protein
MVHSAAYAGALEPVFYSVWDAFASMGTFSAGER